MATVTPLADPTATLAPPSRELLPRLAEREWADDVYLAGSAGLAAYLAHRPVRDLDLMSATNRLRSPERRELLADLLAVDPGLRVETARDGFLYVRAASGVALRFYHYPYPLIDPEEDAAGLPLASLVDLALMKLGAIISRATRRDYVDLHLLCRRLPLVEILRRSPEKLGHVRDFPLQALKGLAETGRAAGEPMPRLAREHSALRWDEVVAWVEGEVRTLARRELGLGDGGDRL